jgi:hypothetical protein
MFIVPSVHSIKSSLSSAVGDEGLAVRLCRGCKKGGRFVGPFAGY